MSITNLRIHFENQDEICYGGQEVLGRITFNLSKEKKMRGVEVRIEGKAHVKWTEQNSSSDSTTTDVYSNRQSYLGTSLCVLGSPGGSFTLPPGDYSYSFRFMLPSNIPSSFEGEYGHVRYVVKGIIHRPWKFDHKYKRAFTVICPLDLNQETNIKRPFQAMKEKELCCGCCSSNALTIVVKLPYCGFVPGQRVNAVVEVDNPTSESVTIKCNLVQNVIFKSSGGRKKEKSAVIAREILGTVPRDGSKTQRSQLKIPSVPPSFLRHCKCIDISYILQVKGMLSGMHSEVTFKVPVIIGTIPLAIQFPLISVPEPVQPTAPPLTNQEPAAGTSDGIGDLPSAAPPYPYQQYPDMPPPTYEECITGKINIRSKDDDKYVQGELEFAPHYPLYHFN